MKKDIFPLVDYDDISHPERWQDKFVTNRYVADEAVRYIQWYLDIERDGGHRRSDAEMMMALDETDF